MALRPKVSFADCALRVCCRFVFLCLMGVPGVSVAGKSDLSAYLRAELDENLKILRSREIKPYYLAYRLHDSTSFIYKVNKGGVLARDIQMTRHADVEMRVGDSLVDNTHENVESYYLNNPYGVRNVLVSLDDNRPLLSRVFKISTDFAYRAAREKYSQILTNLKTRPREKRKGFDFTSMPAARYRDSVAKVSHDTKALEQFCQAVLKASQLFNSIPFLVSSHIIYNFVQVDERMVNSEGRDIAQTKYLSGVFLYVETRTEDGMVLWLDKSYYGADRVPANVKDSLGLWASALISKLDTLRKAPVMDPYAGPVILRNRAAGVFVHEVFGHRVEGHRQKNREEGQTFLSKVGERVTSPLIDILDDPTRHEFGGVRLNGYYRFDDEGVPSQRTVLLEDGVFKNFLQSRSVVFDSGSGNGHGRGNLGRDITSRMGVTVLNSKKNVPFDRLRSQLINRVREKKLEFGLLVEDISGGYALTERSLPQTFKLELLYARQIFADGRPDRVVRGVDVVGTPLVSLSQIIAAGNDPGVFNGYCGAESGWVPVSAIAPSLLFESLEFEKKNVGIEKPPVLAPPSAKVIP